MLTTDRTHSNGPDQSAPAQTPTENATASLGLARQINVALQELRARLYGDDYPPEAQAKGTEGGGTRVLGATLLELHGSLCVALEQLEGIHKRL